MIVYPRVFTHLYHQDTLRDTTSSEERPPQGKVYRHQRQKNAVANTTEKARIVEKPFIKTSEDLWKSLQYKKLRVG